MNPLPLWQQLIIYACILTALYVYVKTSRITIFNRPIISLKYRILLALFFPLIIALAFIFSAFIIAFIIAVIFIISMFALLRKIKISL